MTLEDVQNYETPDLFKGVEVKCIVPDQVEQFSQVFVKAFDMPPEYAPSMAQLLTPSIGLPDVFHYLALVDGKPAGTFSLLRYNKYGIIGSAGVLRRYRRSGVATNLVIRAIREAQQLGIEIIIQQIEAGRLLERLFRINGFQTAFSRTYYSRDDFSG
jgi:GNAT superfamily N-acetyltransferase